MAEQGQYWRPSQCVKVALWSDKPSPTSAARNSCSDLSGAEASAASIASAGVALNGKFQTMKRVADIVFVEAA
jgi:hypothetical protein